VEIYIHLLDLHKPVVAFFARLDSIDLHALFITYLLRPRETLCFVDPRPPLLQRSRGHKTHCFPKVSVNTVSVLLYSIKVSKCE
jgi:hypothetical protein